MSANTAPQTFSKNGYTIAHRHFCHSVSTNSALITAVRNSLLPSDSLHLYTADSQSGGRGQYERTWLSPQGNVYLSLYVPSNPDLVTANALQLHRLTGALSLFVGLALWQIPLIQRLNSALSIAHLPQLQVKWANDLGFYDPDNLIFHKLAGILIEPVLAHHTLLGVVIGVGFNVAIAPPISDGLYTATSYNTLSTKVKLETSDYQAFYAPITDALLNAVCEHNRCTLPYRHITLSDDFIQRFNCAHALHEKPIAIYAQTATTPTVTGICQGIGTDGALLLDTAHGTQPIFAGMAKRLPSTV